MNFKRAHKGFAWVPGLSGRQSRGTVDDSRFTAEEIASVVRAGEAGEKLVDLCRATGITPETYYSWKARYSGLSASQVHDQRRRASLRTRRLALVGSAVLTAVGVGAFLATRPASSNALPPPPTVVPPIAAATPPAPPAVAPPAQPTAAAPVQPPPSAVPPKTPAAQPVVAAPAAPAAPAAKTAAAPRPASDVRSATSDNFAPDGYSVQVAAMPDLQQARAALERLTAAGQPAHITTKTVNGVEIYRVRVGPFSSRDVATQTAERLARNGYESPWITR